MKRILIIGSNGQLGRALVNMYRYLTESVEMFMSDITFENSGCWGFTQLDITNFDQVRTVLLGIQPDVIINCAAMTNVDKCEEDEDLAYKINAIGPKNLAIGADAIGSTLVHISTDYVFSGYSCYPYTEFDKVGPMSVYGSSKLRGEEFVKDFCHKYFIFRTAWLYGDGKNFVNTMLKLAETQDVVNVVDDQIGTPTSAVELARAIKYHINTENYGLYHATCEGSTNWAEFAETIFRKTGLDTKVEHITSYKYKIMNPQSADRPMRSVLENKMMRLSTGYTMMQWEDALDEYLSNRGLLKEE